MVRAWHAWSSLRPRSKPCQLRGFYNPASRYGGLQKISQASRFDGPIAFKLLYGSSEVIVISRSSNNCVRTRTLSAQKSDLLSVRICHAFLGSPALSIQIMKNSSRRLCCFACNRASPSLQSCHSRQISWAKPQCESICIHGAR